MSDSENEFEIDMGDSKPKQPEKPKAVPPPVVQQKVQVEKKPEPIAALVDEFDEFAIEESKAPVTESQPIQAPIIIESISMLTNYLTVTISSDNVITTYQNSCEIYSNSAAVAVYSQSNKLHFDYIITGGLYAEQEEQAEDDKKLGYDPIISYFYGTSRAYSGKMYSSGRLALKRYFNMNKIRYMHCLVN
jgi:hypothetical protein